MTNSWPTRASTFNILPQAEYSVEPQSDARTDPLAFRFALLDLIEQTSLFADELDVLTSESWYGPDFAERSGFKHLYRNSFLSINEGLAEIGGLNAVLDAEGETPEQPILLTKWGGRDPDNRARHLWMAQRSMPHVVRQPHLWHGLHATPMTLGLSLDPSALDEIRDDLLYQAMGE